MQAGQRCEGTSRAPYWSERGMLMLSFLAIPDSCRCELPVPQSDRASFPTTRHNCPNVANSTVHRACSLPGQPDRAQSQPRPGWRERFATTREPTPCPSTPAPGTQITPPGADRSTPPRTRTVCVTWRFKPKKIRAPNPNSSTTSTPGASKNAAHPAPQPRKRSWGSPKPHFNSALGPQFHHARPIFRRRGFPDHRHEQFDQARK